MTGVIDDIWQTSFNNLMSIFIFIIDMQIYKYTLAPTDIIQGRYLFTTFEKLESPI